MDKPKWVKLKHILGGQYCPPPPGLMLISELRPDRVNLGLVDPVDLSIQFLIKELVEKIRWLAAEHVVSSLGELQQIQHQLVGVVRIDSGILNMKMNLAILEFSQLDRALIQARRQEGLLFPITVDSTDVQYSGKGTGLAYTGAAPQLLSGPVLLVDVLQEEVG